MNSLQAMRKRKAKRYKAPLTFTKLLNVLIVGACVFLVVWVLMYA